MSRHFLRRQRGVWLLAAAALLLLSATVCLADKTTREPLPDGGTRVTTTDDQGKLKKTEDTSKTSADGVKTVTTTKYYPDGRKYNTTQEVYKNGKLISEKIEWVFSAGNTVINETKYNEYGQKSYYSSTSWLNGKLVSGHRTTYVYLEPKDKKFTIAEAQYYHSETQTWTGEPPEKPKEPEPQKAQEKPKPQGMTQEDYKKAAEAMSEDRDRSRDAKRGSTPLVIIDPEDLPKSEPKQDPISGPSSTH